MLSIANEDLLIFHCVCFVYNTNYVFPTIGIRAIFNFKFVCFVSFGIKDSNFMMLEDSTIKFLDGC